LATIPGARTGLQDRCQFTPRAPREMRRRCLQSQTKEAGHDQFQQVQSQAALPSVSWSCASWPCPRRPQLGVAVAVVAAVAAVGMVHADRVVLRLPFLWKAPQLAAQSEAIAPSPADQSPGPPAIRLAIVASRSATWIRARFERAGAPSRYRERHDRAFCRDYSLAGSCHELVLAILAR